MGMTNEDLIRDAQSHLHRHKSGDRLFGDVAAVLVTQDGNEYSGVCIDTGSGTGFCAEASAIAAMVTAGEYKISKIVAVWAEENSQELSVLPPCGRCRQFIRQIDETNLETDVVLGIDDTLKLKELIPRYEWPEPVHFSVGS